MDAAFALLSAALFAGNALCVRLGLRGSTPATATLLSVATNLTGLWVLAAARGSLGRALHPAAGIFLLAGMFAPALARLTYYESLTLIGVARAATISNTTPLFSALLAVLVLGERLTWRIAGGTLLVVAGVVLAVRQEGGAGAAGRGRAATTGTLLALNTAVMASVSFMLRKTGLRMLPDPVLGAALTVTGSLVVLVPYTASRWRREPLRADRASLGWLVAGGCLTTGGFLAYYLALHLGDVVRVTPLSNTTPLFAVALLYAFRQVEAVRPATALGAVLAVAGIALVAWG
ncbi:MAG: EamA family transporter [Armatimonadota bacterium]|nr:EamA family transporter [Armatimonadota bacterium]MDR7507330.1 EamA family transporter [Armatimonadota bacterium]MDR7509697.1 EamA family transporter [Armatimonadota bacterium]MDR7515930.1 EamA family transporter [Armatimonadota bacterium]MDR7561900.1 EamA family transporter [Armatimonadota bacterium]